MSRYETALEPGSTKNWGEERNQKSNADRPNTLEQIKTTVSGKLNEFAEMLETRARNASDSNSEATGYEAQAANWVKRSATYIDDLNPQQVKEDIATQVRRNPGKTLLIATAAGLLLGSLLRRR